MSSLKTADEAAEEGAVSRRRFMKQAGFGLFALAAGGAAVYFLNPQPVPQVFGAASRVVVQYPDGTDIDPRSIRSLLYSTDSVAAYGSQNVPLQQRTTKELLVQLQK